MSAAILIIGGIAFVVLVLGRLLRACAGAPEQPEAETRDQEASKD